VELLGDDGGKLATDAVDFDNKLVGSKFPVGKMLRVSLGVPLGVIDESIELCDEPTVSAFKDLEVLDIR